MIKLMREGARKYPWLLKTIVGAIAIAFVITMGWWGFTDQGSDDVASVGKLTVSRAEYRRTYQNVYRYYKEQLPGTYDDQTVRQLVIDGLVDGKLWMLAAEDMGLTVPPDELRSRIMAREDFQRNGRFDPDLYRRLLAANRLTPALFESQLTAELLGEKARTVISQSVALTPSEIEEANALKARQSKAESEADASAYGRILQDILFQKQQRAIYAYKEALKGQVPVVIHREFL